MTAILSPGSDKMKLVSRKHSSVHTLRLFLVKPSKYDDDGFVIRYYRGVLPSNTLACLDSLTRDAISEGPLSRLRVKTSILDELVQRIRPKAIAGKCRAHGVKGVVCLAGVQTNQFERATDLAKEFRSHGLDVLIGGFHVSGSIALSSAVPPEIQELIDCGVTVVAGEIEGRWREILEAAAAGELQSVYNFLGTPPDITHAPVPTVSKSYLRRFAFSNFGTIDCSRGCPFNCTFCTIINVQGRKMRCRDAGSIAEAVRSNYLKSRITYYFLTDDNFARNPGWRALFEAFISLREEEGINVSFMMQVDVLSHRIPGFIEMAKRAGCSQVFIGMESLNRDNLMAVGKRQNRIEEYRHLIDAWRSAEIVTFVGYIIGFPFDTPASVPADIEYLKTEVRPDVASFFMLTPLPGSKDYTELVESGAHLSDDFNTYDSLHETFDHPHLTGGAWTEAFQQAWDSFYSVDHMKNILESTSPSRYWDVFLKLVIYKASVLIDRQHPMVSGLFRVKGRRDRRPGDAPQPWFRHACQRIREWRRSARLWWRLVMEMEELWLRTRKRSEAEERLVTELERMRTDMEHWRRVRTRELRDLCHRAQAEMPSFIARIKERLHLYADSLTYTRAHLEQYWEHCLDQWRSRKFHRIRPDKLTWNFICEMHHLTHFGVAVSSALLRVGS